MKWKSALDVLDPGRLQPEINYKSAEGHKYIVNQQLLAKIVGGVAILLPFAMLSAFVIFGNCFYDSISHFYFTRWFGDIFVIMLAMIGTILIAYQGETGEENRYANFAGVCALVVAFIPTSGSGCEPENLANGRVIDARIFANFDYSAPGNMLQLKVPTNGDAPFQFMLNAEIFHLGAAAFLFGFLAYYTLVVFTRIIPEEHIMKSGELTPAKKNRNGIYQICGVTIVICILALAANATITWLTGSDGSGWNKYNLTFWFEAIALWAFGISWTTKGRLVTDAMMDNRDKALEAA
ncbi:MAG: hypothetical protein WBC71_02560 [Salaquimonas sp.]